MRSVSSYCVSGEWVKMALSECLVLSWDGFAVSIVSARLGEASMERRREKGKALFWTCFECVEK